MSSCSHYVNEMHWYEINNSRDFSVYQRAGDVTLNKYNTGNKREYLDSPFFANLFTLEA